MNFLNTYTLSTAAIENKTALPDLSTALAPGFGTETCPAGPAVAKDANFTDGVIACFVPFLACNQTHQIMVINKTNKNNSNKTHLFSGNLSRRLHKTINIRQFRLTHRH